MANWIKTLNKPGNGNVDLSVEATKYIDTEKGVENAPAALQGAADILAEEVAILLLTGPIYEIFF